MPPSSARQHVRPTIVASQPCACILSQLGPVLLDLDQMPSPAHADALSLWVAALINPLPRLNLAPDVRAEVLCAHSTAERLRIVKAAISDSIRFLQRA